MRKSAFLFAVLSGAVLVAAAPVSGALLTFNSPDATQNAATRTAWLATIGIASPDHLVDFESGFVNGQNIDSVLALFPLGLVINDTSAANAAIIRSGAGTINGSNPVGVFALTQNEQPYLEFDFSSNPVDYFGFLDIDQAGTTGIVTFVGGATAVIGFETTAVSGNSAEFFGIFRNDMPAIVKVQLDASGDGLWAVDNLEYSGEVVPEPGTLALLGLGMAGLGLKKRRSQR